MTYQFTHLSNQGIIPCSRVFETELTLAFLDINPLSLNHILIIPKYHAEKMHSLPDSNLSDILLVVKRIALGVGCNEYNLLQNNGRIAHQEIDHVHFHFIPKSIENGLMIESWSTLVVDHQRLAESATLISKKIEDLNLDE